MLLGLAANLGGGFMKRTAIALKIPSVLRVPWLFFFIRNLLVSLYYHLRTPCGDSVQKSLISFDCCSTFANHWLSFFPAGGANLEMPESNLLVSE
jgi:hypothetical protein